MTNRILQLGQELHGNVLSHSLQPAQAALLETTRSRPALQALNTQLHAAAHGHRVLLQIGDGLTLARKR